MSPFERIYRAMYQLKRDYIPLDNFVVRVHPAVNAEILTDAKRWSWVARDGEAKTFAGLPYEVDPDLNDDGIVLRYEVVA